MINNGIGTWGYTYNPILSEKILSILLYVNFDNFYEKSQDTIMKICIDLVNSIKCDGIKTEAKNFQYPRPNGINWTLCIL